MSVEGFDERSNNIAITEGMFANSISMIPDRERTGNFWENPRIDG